MGEAPASSWVPVARAPLSGKSRFIQGSLFQAQRPRILLSRWTQGHERGDTTVCPPSLVKSKSEGLRTVPDQGSHLLLALTTLEASLALSLPPFLSCSLSHHFHPISQSLNQVPFRGGAAGPPWVVLNQLLERTLVFRPRLLP